jgi:flagellar basal-body rod protein FlgG
MRGATVYFRRLENPSLSVADLAFLGILYGIFIAAYFTPRSVVQQPTGNEADVAVFGPGYFRVFDPLGGRAYLRSGRLSTDRNNRLGLLIESQQFRIDPSITIPADTTAIRIIDDGTILGTQRNGDAVEVLGRILLSTFASAPDAVSSDNQQILRLRGNSSIPWAFSAGAREVGWIRHGWREDIVPTSTEVIGVMVVSACVTMISWLALRLRKTNK